ncbi:hypothetical protein BC567DRAFT_222188 [Phyllosticta citribraziliensis]
MKIAVPGVRCRPGHALRGEKSLRMHRLQLWAECPRGQGNDVLGLLGWQRRWQSHQCRRGKGREKTAVVGAWWYGVEGKIIEIVEVAGHCGEKEVEIKDAVVESSASTRRSKYTAAAESLRDRRRNRRSFAGPRSARVLRRVSGYKMGVC